MFMAQEPQIPSLQDLLKVSVGSTSFLILINASRTCEGGGSLRRTALRKRKRNLPWAHIGSSRLCTTEVREGLQVHPDSALGIRLGVAVRRRGTYPTVDPELLWVRGLLSRNGSRPGCGGGERPETTRFKEGRWGLVDGLHGRRTG